MFTTVHQSPIRRYADVLVHRQLSAAIGYTPLHPSLQSKQHVERVLGNVNKRHRLAQMAGRASVEFYVGLALRGRGTRAGIAANGATREEAFVIRTFRNGLAVFVSKSVEAVCRHCVIGLTRMRRLGIEGLVTFSKDEHEFDIEDYTLHVPGPGGRRVAISVFDKIVVDVSIEKDKNTQRGKVKMAMRQPANSDDL